MSGANILEKSLPVVVADSRETCRWGAGGGVCACVCVHVSGGGVRRTIHHAYHATYPHEAWHCRSVLSGPVSPPPNPNSHALRQLHPWRCAAMRCGAVSSGASRCATASSPVTMMGVRRTVTPRSHHSWPTLTVLGLSHRFISVPITIWLFTVCCRGRGARRARRSPSQRGIVSVPGGVGAGWGVRIYTTARVRGRECGCACGRTCLQE